MFISSFARRTLDGASRATLFKGGGGVEGAEALSESPRCNDMVADLHFPRFFGTAIKCEIARRFPRSVVKVGLHVQCKNISISSGIQPWTSTDLKIIIFQYIICEPFRSWKEGLVKLNVNLWEIWRLKCRRSTSGPLSSKILDTQDERVNPNEYPVSVVMRLSANLKRKQNIRKKYNTRTFDISIKNFVITYQWVHWWWHKIWKWL